MKGQHKEVYVYHDGEFVQKCRSMYIASKIANISQPSVRNNIDRIVNKNKWYFSSRELSEKELEDLFKEKPKPVKRTINYRIKKIGNQEYSVKKDLTITNIPPKRAAAIQALREFITAKLSNRWMTIDKRISTLERQRVNELLEALR